MLGAIAGDIIGSTHEIADPPTKIVDFGPLFTAESQFTDDTILTIATAQAILDWIGPKSAPDYRTQYLSWGRRYPSRYSAQFSSWLKSDTPAPYNSFGNGAAMRVSPVGWTFDSLQETLEQARLSASPYHNHREGIKGAQAVSHTIYMARGGYEKDKTRRLIEAEYGYDLRRTIDEIRPDYRFDMTCQGTVPEAIIAFLESDDFESSVRLAISLGGDADTLACITGSIAEAFYGGVPSAIEEHARSLLPREMIAVVDQFYARFMSPRR